MGCHGCQTQVFGSIAQRTLTQTLTEQTSISLQIQKLLLALHTPPVPGKRAVASDDPMARHGYGNRIACASPRHGPDRAGLTDGLRKLRIAPGFPAGNLPQRLPDPRLEGSCTHIQRNVSGCRMIGHGSKDTRHCSAIPVASGTMVAALNCCRSNPSSAAASSPNMTLQTPRSVAATSTNPSSQGAVAKRIVSCTPRSRNRVGLIPRLPGRLFVKTAGRPIPGLVNRSSHACSRRREAAPHLAGPQLCLVPTRAYTQHPGEFPLDSERAAVGDPG